MTTDCDTDIFSGQYAAVHGRRFVAREETRSLDEALAQALWYDQCLPEGELRTVEGHRLKVVSPGYWNRVEGPDFRGAQIEFNGVLHAGDVEIHLEHGGWKAHGHHRDPRYNAVILHVVWQREAPRHAVETADGRRLPTLLLGNLSAADRAAARQRLGDGNGVPSCSPVPGACAGLLPRQGSAPLARMLDLAGEWRMLEKARILGARMARVGPEQAVYESLAHACGYSRFKDGFREIARHFPYERARQLAQQDGMLLEAGLLQVAGLLPDGLAARIPHFERLQELRRKHLPGLRSLPITWTRVGVRPNNNPERRLAGLARILARTAREGLVDTLEDLWREEMPPLARRRAFEKLFPPAVGFWATHCTWSGKRLATAGAPLGAGRVRSIIGNVFVTAALALARARRDRAREERIHAFFRALPMEPRNHVVRHMACRLLGDAKPLKLNFQRQQGMLQLYLDWCEPNPSCRNCAMHGHLGQMFGG